MHLGVQRVHDGEVGEDGEDGKGGGGAEGGSGELTLMMAKWLTGSEKCPISTMLTRPRGGATGINIIIK